MKIVVGLIVMLAFHATGQTPAGWQVMKDRKQLCQISTPAGWTADKIMPGSITAGDKKASAIFGSKPADATYAEIVKMAKDMFKPTKIFEETGTRTWFASAPETGKKGMNWYVAMSTNPVCEAQIQFSDPAFETSAKQIVNSLKSTK
jgi:hypothetical protein